MLTLLAGCKEGSNDVNFGPAVSAEEIEKAENDVFSMVNPMGIETGEFAYFIRTQEIFSTQEPAKSIMEEEGLTVVDREDHPEYFILTTFREVIDHVSEDSPHYKFKDVYGVLKPGAEKPLPDNSTKKLNLLNDTEEIEQPENAISITFHNLNKREILVSKPQKVLERDPCPAGEDCRIKAMQLTYDVVIQEAGKAPQKNSVELIVSNQVPYFASVLKSCITAVLEIDNTRPLVRQCRSIHDYQYKNPDAPL